MPLHILLTKCDKLKRGAQKSALLSLKKTLGNVATIQLFSSTHQIGKEDLLRQIQYWITEVESLAADTDTADETGPAPELSAD